METLETEKLRLIQNRNHRRITLVVTKIHWDTLYEHMKEQRLRLAKIWIKSTAPEPNCFNKKVNNPASHRQAPAGLSA
jgi:hypothetical protein